MDIEYLLMDASLLMGIGMVVVFVFLTTLMLLVQFMSKTIPQRTSPPTIPPHLSIQSSSQTISPQIRAAISAAVHQYRNTETNQQD